MPGPLGVAADQRGARVRRDDRLLQVGALPAAHRRGYLRVGAPAAEHAFLPGGVMGGPAVQEDPAAVPGREEQLRARSARPRGGGHVSQVGPAAHRGRRGVNVDGDLLRDPGLLREQPRGGQGGGGDRGRAQLAGSRRRREHRVGAAQRHLRFARLRFSGCRQQVTEDGPGTHPKTRVSSTRWSWLGIGSHSSASILLNVSVYSMRLENAPDGMCGVLASPAQLS